MVKQFEVYWIDLDPTRGSEINKKRPGIVISPNEMNNGLLTVIIAPITSKIRNYPMRTKVKIKGRNGEVALDHLRSIDKSRLLNKVCSISKKEQEDIRKMLINIFS